MDKPSATLVVGYYTSAKELLLACTAARDAGHPQVEAVSPYPIHGIDPVLGIPRSHIGRPVLLTALLGFVAAYGFLYHMQVVDYPIQVSGKPFHYWVGLVVPTLELGLLAAALVNLGVLFHAIKALPLPEPMLLSPRLTDDAFAIVIPVRDGFTEQSLETWLRDRGAQRVEIVAPAQRPHDAEPEKHDHAHEVSHAH